MALRTVLPWRAIAAMCIEAAVVVAVVVAVLVSTAR